MIPHGITREHILEAASDYRRGTEHRFAESIRYDVLINDERFPPKAVVGLAAAYVTGQPLKPEDFSGGLGSTCFRLLRDLGFDVVLKPGVTAPSTFHVGGMYTRHDVYQVLKVPTTSQGGDWDTGYHRHGDEWFIFCTLGQSRTGHEYGNHFEGNELVWFGRTGSRADHPSIQSLTSGELPVHVFFRPSDREPFEYAGVGQAVHVSTNSVPVEIRWRFDDEVQRRPERLAEEITGQDVYLEGAIQLITVNAYERNPAARRRCIEHYGARCVACGFDFEAVYGDRGKGFIHVHHLHPLARRGGEYELDPVADLRPLCPNCHAMIHNGADTLSIDALKELIRR